MTGRMEIEIEQLRSTLYRMKIQRNEAVKKWRQNHREQVNLWAAQRYARMKNDPVFMEKTRMYQKTSRRRRKEMSNTIFLGNV